MSRRLCAFFSSPLSSIIMVSGCATDGSCYPFTNWPKLYRNASQSHHLQKSKMQNAMLFLVRSPLVRESSFYSLNDLRCRKKIDAALAPKVPGRFRACLWSLPFTALLDTSHPRYQRSACASQALRSSFRNSSSGLL